MSVRRKSTRKKRAIMEFALTNPLAKTSILTRSENYTSKWIRANLKIPDPSDPSKLIRSDAFGEIEFDGRRRYGNYSKYVKISDKTDPSNIYHLMTKIWNTRTSNLVISIEGSSQKLRNLDKTLESFSKSLVKCAGATGAWIISGGTYNGITKHIAHAVEDYDEVNVNGRIPTIGIATWDMIKSNNMLRHPEGLFPAHYDSEGGYSNKLTLDWNHTHFILVDDGTVNLPNREKTWRLKFEDHMKSQTVNQANVLLVCIVIHGGPKSLLTVDENIKNENPVILVKGSGGWADILSKIYLEDPKVIDTLYISKILEGEGIYNRSATEIETWTDLVVSCMKNKQYLNIFELTRNTSHDFDKSLLQALLNNPSVQGKEFLAEQQVELAMAWNRSDIAKSHILKDGTLIGWSACQRLFFKAVKEDKPQFCKLLLDTYNVSLRLKYCMVHVVGLYTDLPPQCLLSRILEVAKHATTRTSKIVTVMKHLMGSEYNAKDLVERNTNQRLDKPVGRQYGRFLSVDESNLDPFKEIFLFCILNNKQELAAVIWEQLVEPFPAAIAACAILRRITSFATDTEEQRSLINLSDHYESVANDLLSHLFHSNERKTHWLLVRKREQWGEDTCLHMAKSAKAMVLFANPAIQTLLNNIWKGSMILNTSAWTVWLAVVFPFMVPWCINIIKDDCDQENFEDVEYGEVILDDETDIVEDVVETCSQWKYIRFYTCPVTIFACNVMSTIIFLTLFAYVILCNFYFPLPSIPEWILAYWTLTLFLEELRQLLTKTSNTLWGKVWAYLLDQWNFVDMGSFLLFSVAFLFRFFEQFFATSRLIMSTSFVFYCIGIIHIFAVSQHLGPKIVMVGKMLKDLGFFLLIMLIFLLAYGVSSQAIMYPNETRVTTLFSGIVYRPYWHIYGELFLDEINYNNATGGYSCSSNETLIASGHRRCPERHTIVTIMGAIYVLLANVLLLNLLIAMFSNTFEQVEENTDTIWKYQRYRLIKTYYCKPPLPPPFAILSNLFTAIRQFRGKDSRRSGGENAFRRDFSPGRVRQLIKWERWHVGEAKHKIYARSKETDNYKLDQLNEKMNRLVSVMGNLEDCLAERKRELQ